ncbi:MAG TPA: phosphotransferase [Jatrophihabitantaceae bacterium]|jgi:aminoglycoside phosphotransferase (APT) family kinase protein|nr:phosphotransferase [Jatrophihabitantaceae bacterium]
MLDDQQLRWVLGVAGAEPREVHGLRSGGAPWLLQFDDREFVLRVAPDAETVQIERKALVLAGAHGIAVPRLIAASNDPPLLLIERVRGSSAIPRQRPTARLRRLGELAARVHSIHVPFGFGLPERERSIADVDFDALRAAQPSQPLLVQAEEVARSYRPSGPAGLVHGDLWQGNAIWDGDDLMAVIDWDCAGAGQAGIDLGSARCDAATAFGVAAADDVLAGWQTAAGRPPDDVAYWDVVGALSTPPDMGWFVESVVGQGRSDLRRDVMVERRDDFLRAALDAL